MSYVSRAEALVFAARNGWGDDKKKTLEDMLASCTEVPVDHPAVLDAYAECHLRLRQQKKSANIMGPHDKWIAATARVAGAPLLSTDKDFNHLQGWIDFEYIDAPNIPKNWQPPASQI